MGGGRSKDGTTVYRRVNGVYVRTDGKPIKYRRKVINLIEDKMAVPEMTPTERAQANPLPQTGRQVKGFLQRMMATENLNDSWTEEERNQFELYQKLVDGRLQTENGGFLFQDGRSKNHAYLTYNDMPGYKEVLNQVIPQLTAQNLRRVIVGNQTPVIDGNPEATYLWEFETFVRNNSGERVRTYVKIYPFHSNEGKPYAILVGLHRTAPMVNRATAAQRG